MASHMRTSQAGLDIIKVYEGFRPQYQRLPNGRWIIGYGHMRAEKSGNRINEAEAEALLREYDLPPIERLVGECILAPLNQNEFDALVSFAFNLGSKTFLKSDVVARLNSGERMEAADAFDHWRSARIGGKVQMVDALIRRRAAEKALFLKAPGAMGIASSRLVRPLADRAPQAALPAPTEIIVERKAIEPAPGPAERLPEDTLREASEAVRRQMARILDGAPEDASPAADLQNAATPEEITAAVSELVQNDAAPETTAVKSVWPSRSDLPPPPFFEQAEREVNEAPSAVAADIIDDLEPISVDPNGIDRAIEINREVAQEDTLLARRRAYGFAGLALVGAVMLFCGLVMLFLRQGAESHASANMFDYVSLGLTLLGGILFALMAVYSVRAFIGEMSSP